MTSIVVRDPMPRIIVDPRDTPIKREGIDDFDDRMPN